MRKNAIVFTAALLLVALVVALFAAGCGTAQTAAQAGASTPQDILNSAVTAATPMTNATGTFDLNVTVNGDATKMPAQMKDLLSKPITISGTMAVSEKPTAADINLKISLAGQDIPVGVRVLDKKVWVQFMNQWYEAPAEVTKAMSSTSSTADAKTTSDSMMKALKDAGIDPMTWISGLQNVGVEDVAGAKAYHLKGTIDLTKLMTDVMKIASDKTLQSKFMGAAGAMGSTDTSVTLPSATQLATIQTEVANMFKNVTVDMWITEDGFQLRKGEFNATVVPPAGQDAQGITDIAIKASFTVTPSKNAVSVTAPTGAKPFTDLQQALSGLSQMFGGALGGLTGSGTTGTTMGAGSSATDTTVQ